MNNVPRMDQKERPRRAQQPKVRKVKVRRSHKQWLELFRRARDIAQTTHTYEFGESK
ncbi:MAG TPA: hypothetical protein VI758_08165 [Bacteroidota bacterium]